MYGYKNEKEVIQYRNNYNKENYDRVNICFKKGKKQVITNHYKNKGYTSMNEYINALVDNDMEQ